MWHWRGALLCPSALDQTVSIYGSGAGHFDLVFHLMPGTLNLIAGSIHEMLLKEEPTNTSIFCQTFRFVVVPSKAKATLACLASWLAKEKDVMFYHHQQCLSRCHF